MPVPHGVAWQRRTRFSCSTRSQLLVVRDFTSDEQQNCSLKQSSLHRGAGGHTWLQLLEGPHQAALQHAAVLCLGDKPREFQELLVWEVGSGACLKAPTCPCWEMFQMQLFTH